MAFGGRRRSGDLSDPQMALTNSVIKAVKAKPSQDRLHDEKGLLLTVRPSGYDFPSSGTRTAALSPIGVQTLADHSER